MSKPAEMNERVTGVLNAIGETQREHSLTLAGHGKRLERLEGKVDDGFARVEADARRNFTVLNHGMAQIKALLDAAVDRPDETGADRSESAGR